jgi:hypothetical protein
MAGASAITAMESEQILTAMPRVVKATKTMAQMRLGPAVTTAVSRAQTLLAKHFSVEKTLH